MVEELSLSSCVEVQNARRIFEIELKEGKTTIASWTQLLHDSRLPVDSPYLLQHPVSICYYYCYHELLQLVEKGAQCIDWFMK